VIRIQPNQVQNLQQIEAVVAGPEGANRLFTVAGQFEIPSGSASQNQTFTVLVGPSLTRQQFLRAIATASLTKTTAIVQSLPSDFGWGIAGIDADWDDESGQVELRIEAFAYASGANNSTSINSLAFQVTILAAMTAKTPPGFIG